MSQSPDGTEDAAPKPITSVWPRPARTIAHVIHGSSQPKRLRGPVDERQLIGPDSSYVAVRMVRHILRGPAIWGVLYLALIPTFALLFCRPGQFYEPYISHETAVATHDENQIAQSVQNTMRRQERAHWPAGYVRDGSARIPIGSIDVSSVRALPDRIDAVIDYSSLSVLQGGAIEFASGNIAISLTPIGYYGFPGKPVTTEFAVATAQGAYRRTLRFFFPFKGPGVATDPAQPILESPPSLTSRLRSYRLETAGDPYFASDEYLRMLYVSATVVTTLGEGDIVPVAIDSRVLVAAEVVLGLVFAGLFFNSLANAIRRHRQLPPGSATHGAASPL